MIFHYPYLLLTAKHLNKVECVVIICNGKDCKKKGYELKRAVKKQLKENGCFKKSLVMCTKCNGMCKQGPIVGVQPANEWVTKANKKKVAKLLDKVC